MLTYLTSLSSFAQIWAGQEIDINSLNTWNTNKLSDYEGVYSFGFSESESEMTIAIDQNQICVQLKSGDWVSENGKIIGWRSEYINYTDVKIEGDKFFSNETNGEFIIYRKGNRSIKCLKIDTPPVQTGEYGQYEIGPQIKNVCNGKYPNTKLEIINDEYLKLLPLIELKIMRNEIFARYGYIFKKGGEMALYFQKQEWYSGDNKNIEPFLTDIEKLNIKAIKMIEQVKKTPNN